MNVVIKSQNLKTYYLKSIKESFEGRMIRDAHLYRSSRALNQTYKFFKGIIDILQELHYNNNTN